MEGEGCEADVASPLALAPFCETFTAGSGAEGEAACAGAPTEAAGAAAARLRPAVSQPSGSGSGSRTSGGGGSGFSASTAGEAGAAGRDGVFAFFFELGVPPPSASSRLNALNIALEERGLEALPLSKIS